MKFCMVTTFYPPYHFGGDATYVKALAEALVAKGHEVTVVHCEDAFSVGNDVPVVEEPQDPDIKVVRLKMKAGILSPLITQQLGVPGLKAPQLKALFEEDFDVVNFHNVSLIGGPAIINLSRARLNLYTLHEHWLLCPTHIFWKNKQKACDKKACVRCSLRSGIPPQWWRYTSLIKRSLKTIDAFIAPSQFTASVHERDLELEAPVHVIPLFSKLDPGPHTPAAGSASDSRLEFLYVGRMTASKGVEELLASFEKWPQYTLTVVGSGELLAPLQRRYQDCSHIQFHGPVAQADLIEHYRRATALILPSIAPETFGLTIVEAFSCGTPAIVRAAGGNREIIDRSAAGFVYHREAELLEALETFQSRPALRRELGLKARDAFEEHYRQETHVSAYLALIDQLGKAKSKDLLALAR